MAVAGATRGVRVDGKTMGRQRRPGVIPYFGLSGGRPCRTLGRMAVISAAKYVIFNTSLMETRPSEVDDVFRTRATR